MAQKVRYKVQLIESERGWGQKVDKIEYFDDPVEAKQFVDAFNASNNKDYVPDWYMYATDPKLEYYND